MAENQKEETDSSEDSNSIQYKCLWEGCKVYGKGSSSKLWLEKHVMSHGGNKPFQCIVDGCKHRFGTQVRISKSAAQRAELRLLSKDASIQEPFFEKKIWQKARLRRAELRSRESEDFF